MNKKGNICRLCFVNTGNQCEMLYGLTKEIFDVLLIGPNLDICQEPAICDDCFKKALRCLCFKSVCIGKEQQILSSTIIKEETSLLMDERVNKKSIDADTCSLCMNVVRSDETNIGSLTQMKSLDMFPLFLPEKNFQSQKNHVACSSCREEIVVYFHFITNCIYIEKMINIYIRQNMRMIPINLIDFRDWLVGNGLDSYDKYVQKRLLNGNVRIRKRSARKCDLCPYVAKRKEYLKSHMLKHKQTNEVTIYKCYTCGHETRWRRNLKRHMLIHNDSLQAETYKCSICTYETKHKNNLKRHDFKHLAVYKGKMYKCLECPYESKYKDVLTRHSFTHTTAGETHKCPYEGCTFDTKWKGYLKMHTLSHKDDSEVEIYKCNVCDYQTKLKNNLKKHSLVHKDASVVETYKCTDCSYESKRKGNLQAHMLVHMDAAQVGIKCDVCGFVTKSKKYLKGHMKVHQKEDKKKTSSDIVDFKS